MMEEEVRTSFENGRQGSGATATSDSAVVSDRIRWNTFLTAHQLADTMLILRLTR
jgi:hypothetical protein